MVCGRELNFSRKEAGSEVISGVFPRLVNKAAFVDKLTVGVDGDLRRRIDPEFEITANPAIGGPGRPYGRSKHIVYKATGNPFEVKYGANRLYRHLTDTKVIVRSEGTPLSCAEVMEILARLFRKGHRNILRAVEFTFDTSIPFGFFETHVLTRAQSVRTLTDDRNRRTLYAGAPGAEWMLRVYEKTGKTTRVEFVFRHSFLVKVGVSQLENLGDLKNVELNRMVRFPAICQRAFEDLICGFTGKRLATLRKWPGHWFSRTLLEVLEDFGLEGDEILRVSAEEQLLKRMQDGFKW
jgi:hypothetical protein